MRALTLLILSFVAATSLSSCGLIAHQARTAQSLLRAPFRVELEKRFLDEIPELERESRISLWS